MSQIKRIVEKHKVQDSISLELQKSGIPTIKLGTFRSKTNMRKKGKSFLSIPAQLKLNVRSKPMVKRIKAGAGYFLVVKNRTGKILSKTRISLKDKTKLKLRTRR